MLRVVPVPVVVPVVVAQLVVTTGASASQLKDGSLGSDVALDVLPEV